MRGQQIRRLVHGALAPILLTLASLACLSLRAQDLPSALTPTAAWMPGEKARYQYQQSVRETEGTKDEVKFVSNGVVDIEVLANDNGVLRFRWLRRVDNAEWEVARMPFPIRGHAGERLIRASIEEGLPVLVQFDTRTRRGSVENVDELATRVKRLFDKVGGDDTRRPRTPDEQLAANQQPSAGIYRMRGIHEKQVISPKGVAAWYARMALAEIEEFVVPFGRRYGCDAPVQADFPVRRPVAGNSAERGSYQCKQLGPGLALLAADRKRSGIVDYASGAPNGPATAGEADAEPVVAATTELTNRHEMAVDTGWPQRVANAQTDVSESGKTQARTVIRRVYLRQ